MKSQGEINTSRVFAIGVALYALLWTLLPSLVRYNLPLDSLEGATWGQHLQWGYDKDPILNAWLTRLAVEIGHYQPWVIYLFSQIAVVVCFWAVWRLAKQILDPLKALTVVFMLMGVQYYNIAAIDFNDNVLGIPLWVLTVLCFYQALHSDRSREWIGVGVFAGLAFLAKYYVLMLLIPMLLLLLWDRQYWHQWEKPGVYVGIAVFIAVIFPHLLWLMHHDFITLRYSTHQVGESLSLSARVMHPLHFAMTHVLGFLVPVVLYGIALFSRKNCLGLGGSILSSGVHLCTVSSKRTLPSPLGNFYCDRRVGGISPFLLFTAVGPLIMTVLVVIITGGRLHTLWGMPLVSLWGILFFAITGAPITPKIFYRFTMLMAVCVLLMAGGYAISLIHARRTSSANYPGEEMARYTTKLWHTRFSTPLPMVVGPRWVAGNIAFYSADHPEVFINGEPRLNPWWQAKKMRRGALFVWDGRNMPLRLPTGPLHSMVFHWHRGGGDKSRVKLFFAVLPPARI